MTTPTGLRDNGSRLRATTTTSTPSDLPRTVALSLTTPMTPPALARPARSAQPTAR